MQYKKIVYGKFIARPNRFIAHVEVNGVAEIVHVKNTGRCRELLIPGVEVILEDCDTATRKTRYDLIAVYKKDFGLINIDSQAPNKVAGEWICKHKELFPEITFLKPNIPMAIQDLISMWNLMDTRCSLR